MGDEIISSSIFNAEWYEKSIESRVIHLKVIRSVQIMEGNAAAVENANNKYEQLVKLTLRTCDVAERDAGRIATIADTMIQHDEWVERACLNR